MKLRMLMSVLVSAALAAALVPSAASPASAHGTGLPDPDVRIERVAGADRYETSLRAARRHVRLLGGSAASAVAVFGNSWPDAVVASALSGTSQPMLLISPETGIGPDQEAFLRDSKIAQVTIVAAADSSTDGAAGPLARAASQLKSLGISVSELGGPDAESAAVAVADRVAQRGGGLELGGYGRTVMVATDATFADALAAGPVSARWRIPVLLTGPDRLHPDAKEWIADNDIAHVILLGGTAALSEQVERDASGRGVKITRLAGRDRFDTAARIADFAAIHIAGDCFSQTQGEAALARADKPWDALGAGPLLARMCAPLAFAHTDRPSAASQALLARYRHHSAPERLRLYVFGGAAAVTDEAAAGSASAAYTEYENRSPDSVLPADDRYFIDHNEVRSLFPQCPSPEGTKWDPNPDNAPDIHMSDTDHTLRNTLFKGFDTSVREAYRHPKSGNIRMNLATGWFTDESVRKYWTGTYTDEFLTEKSARKNGDWHGPLDVLWLGDGPEWLRSWSTWYYSRYPERDRPDWSIFADQYPGLWHRLTEVTRKPTPGNPNTDPLLTEKSYNMVYSLAASFVDQYGIHNPAIKAERSWRDWPDSGGALLFDWMRFMLPFAPVTHEPAAWGMHTLLSTYQAPCVAKEMLRICDDAEVRKASAHLNNRHDGELHDALGIVFGSLLCGDNWDAVERDRWVVVTDPKKAEPAVPTITSVTSMHGGLSLSLRWNSQRWKTPAAWKERHVDDRVRDYDVQYRFCRDESDGACKADKWSRWTDRAGETVADISPTLHITGLKPGVAYQVRVRGQSDRADAESRWSDPVAGKAG